MIRVNRPGLVEGLVCPEFGGVAQWIFVPMKQQLGPGAEPLRPLTLVSRRPLTYGSRT